MLVSQVDYIYPLHILSAVLLAIFVWIATGMLWLRLRKSGGFATLLYMVFFCLMGFMAVCDIPSVSARTPEEATFWGTLGLGFGLTAWFVVYLSGEYSRSDRPAPWRVASVGILFGFCLCGLFLTVLLPLGDGAVIMTYIVGYGWRLSLAPVFIFPVGCFIVGSILLFFQFCLTVFRTAPRSPYGGRVRVFIYVITASLSTVVGMSMGRFLFIESAAYFVTIEMYLSIIWLVLIFYLFYNEPSIVFLIAQRALCVFVLNTAGIIYYEHSFEQDDAITEYIDLFAPALTAINFIVKESLELREVEWIRQFSTNQRTFLLDVRLEADLVGVLLVSKPTQLLRSCLSRFMADFITTLSLHGSHSNIDQGIKEKLDEILYKAFPFLKN